MEKWMCLGSMIVAGVVLLLYGLDLAIGIPFGRIGLVQDIVLVIAAALVLWQGYETWREFS